MKVSDSVRRAIDEWEDDELECSMLHACNAVDGTAKRAYPDLGNQKRFVALLRDGYPILQPSGFGHINLTNTRFPVRVQRVTAPPGPDGRRLPDAADLIYGVHRCTQGHGDELPGGFDLTRDAHDIGQLVGGTTMGFAKGEARLSDRVIFAMLTIVVLHPVNAVQTIAPLYKLWFGEHELVVDEWWGRRDDFLRELLLPKHFPEGLTMDFGEWGDDL